MKLAFSLLVLSLTLGLSARAELPPEDGKDFTGWHRLVGILQYLQSDYPAAAQSQLQSELAEQRTLAAEALATAAELGHSAQQFAPRLHSIQARIDRAEDAEGVSRDCAALIEDLVATAGLSRSPRRPPELEKGRQLYAVACAACHALNGSGEVELAAQLQPKPPNFLESRPLDASAPYKAFNVITFGVEGTSMPSFEVLSEDERWALAFYIFTLRQTPCDHKPPRASLERLAISTDEQLAGIYGPQEIACLRRAPPKMDEEQALLLARSGIENALLLSSQGKAIEARKSIVDAYLRGVEPVEPMLKGRDPALVQELEQGFVQARIASERGNPQFTREARRLLTLIDRARRGPESTSDFWSVFWLALLVLVREGFEATVVIAALLAVLKKVEHREHERVVHLGWMLAIGLGAIVFLFSHRLLAVANRELLEALVALVAVGLLVYAALWLNARSTMRRFMGGLRARMQGAVGSGGAWGLFSVSFTAMLRESFETAVFLQGLSIDSPAGAAWGAVGGAAVLLGLVIFVNRVGYRLPMKTLFNASTVLLLITAVVLLGKGLHSLQTLGILPLMPIPFFRIEPLGIFPDGYTLLAQLALALAPLLWFWLRREPRSTSEVNAHPGQFQAK